MEKIYYTEEEKQQIMDERKKVIDENKVVKETTETPIDYDKLLNDELENENNEIKNTDTRFVLKYPVIKINDINEEAFTTEEKRFKINKKMAGILAGIMMATSIPIIAASTRKNNNSNENSSESISSISTTTSTSSNQTTSIESSIQDELDKYSKIKYLTKDEYVELLKSAEKEFEGIDITTEELAAFVTEVNKTIINSDLKKVLVSSGVLNEKEELNRQNYLNALDKIRNSMINAYTIEIDPELVGMPEYDELIKELKDNAVKVHVSNIVSKKSSEYETYVELDKAYDLIGNSETLKEATVAYEPILELVNSENGKNMPNNMEEEIYKDLYKDAYDEITASKYNVSITELDRVYDYVDSEECSKSL